MTGKARPKGAAAAAVSTGGSLISDAKLKQLYTTMVQCRLVTERARGPRKPPLSGGLCDGSIGQEAIVTGCTIDLRPEDTIALAPQDSIAGLVKGVPLDEIVAQIYTSRTRARRSKPAQEMAHNIIPLSSSLDAQLSMATQIALANKQKKNSSVVVAFTCYATTALRCWREALACAAKSGLPVIFVVENNPWALPGPKARDKKQDLAHVARSYNFPIIAVDGNDVVAVYRVAYECLERVRQGGGPVLVEGKTYRLPGAIYSTTAWRAERDPMTHMERYLTAKRLFTARWKNQIMREFSGKLDAAFVSAAQKKAEEIERPPRN